MRNSVANHISNGTALTPRWLVKSVGLFAFVEPLVQRGIYGEWPTLLFWALMVLCTAIVLGLIVLGAGGFDRSC
jgi:hypothetical protein